MTPHPDNPQDSSHTPLLPVIVICAADDQASVRMNINGRPVKRPIARAELGGLLSHLTESWGTAIRIEAHEPEGTIHADLLTPRTQPVAPTPNRQGPDPRSDINRPDQPTGITAAGLQPGEPVHIALLIQTTTADQAGRITVQVPRRTRRYRSAPLIIHGKQSGATRLPTAP